jgi:HK97 family phage prohead protease
MAIKSDREYRNLGAFNAESEYIVEGYASTFEPYELLEIDGVKFYEQIDRHAFDEADMSDVVFLRDHEGRVMARTKNNTIQLDIDDHGLHQRTDLSKTQASRDMAEDIAVGNYSQMSFAFTVAEDHFDRDTNTRIIDRVRKVYDISAVSFPANPQTEIGLSMRDYFNGEIEMIRAERLEAEKRAHELEKLKLRIRLMEENK